MAELSRVLGGTLALVGLLFVAVILGRAAWEMYGKFVVASNARHAAEQEQASVGKRYAEVQEAVAELSSPRGEEKKLRERYGVAKPGEGEITIVRNEEAAAAAQLSQPSFLSQLWDRLFVW